MIVEIRVVLPLPPPRRLLRHLCASSSAVSGGRFSINSWLVLLNDTCAPAAGKGYNLRSGGLEWEFPER